MIEELTRARITPYAHQHIGIQNIVAKPVFFLADEMGAGKTKQAIDAAQVLFSRGIIEKVLVIAPASVRAVWFDPELGELAKHLWSDTTSEVTEFHSRTRRWARDGTSHTPLMRWVVTNYDFIRSKARLEQLLPFCSPKTMLVLDESSAVKNHRAKQTKACLQLRRKCGRVLLLNGTPIANSPEDMFSQGNIMSPTILGCPTYIHFRSRYAIMGGFLNKQIVAWHDLPDMQERFAPYVLRRLKVDCLDLPPKLPPVTLTATLTEETWKLYKEMRDELVAWLDAATVSAAPQAVVKALRLAQLTSGFLGGLTDALREPLATVATADRPEWLPFLEPPAPLPASEGDVTSTDPIREVGQEKMHVFFGWLDEQLEADPNLKLLVWCRFRPEVARLEQVLLKKYPQVSTGVIWGGQTEDRWRFSPDDNGNPFGKRVMVQEGERGKALRLLDPRTMPFGPVVVVGTPSSGSMGLNLSGAHTVLYISNDYSLKTRLQSEDRVHRPGQTYPVSYFDLIATGPAGQKTIDHTIMKALRSKDNLATWTIRAWIHELTEE